MTSLYIINPKNLLMEFFLFNFLSGDSKKYIERIVIKSNFSLENIILFIENNFPDKKKKIEIMKNNIDYIKNNTIKKFQLLIKDFFEIDDNNSLKNIKICNFFSNKTYIKFFLSYIPLIYYSIMELIYFNEQNNNKNKIQQNENMNIILDSLRIFCYYQSISYIEYLKKEGEDFKKIL